MAGIEALSRIFAERLLNSIGAGVALASLVWLLLRVAKRANSGTRFAVWFSSLIAIAAFPLFAGIRLQHAPWGAAAAAHGEFVLPSRWGIYAFGAWCCGATILLLRLAAGIWRVRALRRQCVQFDPASLDQAIAEMLQGSRRRVSLCTSSELAVPAAVGLFRPAIVFPARLFSELSSEEMEMIVRHELAHLERWDDWTNLAQKVLKAMLFFHPAVWWVENRLALEREMACDDVVLAQTRKPRAYALSLIACAEKLQRVRGMALVQALVSRMHQMSARVAQILDDRRAGGTRLWKAGLSLSAGLMAVLLGAAPYAPRLVTFQPTPSLAQTPQASADVGSAAFSRMTVEHAQLTPASYRVRAEGRARVIPAFLHSRRVNPTAVRKQTPPIPTVVRAVAQRQAPAVHETILVLRSSQEEAAGAAPQPVWTLCIWTIESGNSRLVHSAIVVSWI